ncbi:MULTISPECIES: hypothetical protein [Methylomonas]|uniref:Uncharacterized protein n=2 Tax=Methylomonas TaxID=416 RepID=A0A126T7P0_9GAMM|nr:MULTISPECIES: hypothetical protein [Methylomonas]AMK78050.1 hypothetical protein JT25_016450 [Methylomonas denitrificans]OAI07652.1 hypothetical protein A1342_10190 [Methylomonas methanica]TCV85585.1 hypothetical protein EDE11_105147 [Methylomonas methanica]
MPAFLRASCATLLLLLVAACANLNQDLTAGTDSPACVGDVIQPPVGMVEVVDAELRQAAEGEPGKGKLCKAKIFLVQMPVAVYRIWDSAWPDRARGNWWTLNYPAGSRDSYRQAEAICPEWSGLDRLIVCTVKVGTRVAIGPAQSADCANGLSYKPSPENQVYIPNDSRNNQVFVENCSNGAPWPAP